MTKRSRTKPTFVPSAGDDLRTFRLELAKELIECLQYYVKCGGIGHGGSLIPDLEEVLDCRTKQQEPRWFQRVRYRCDSAAQQFLSGRITVRMLVDYVTELRSPIVGAPWDAEEAVREIDGITRNQRMKAATKQSKISEVLSSGLFETDSRRGVRDKRATELDEAGAIWRPDTEHSSTTRFVLTVPERDPST